MAFTVMRDKGRTVTSLNYFSDNSQNLAGDSECKRQSSVLQSLACFCSLIADSLMSGSSPVKRHKFCLLTFKNVKLLLNLASGFFKLHLFLNIAPHNYFKKSRCYFFFTNLILVNGIVTYIIQLVEVQLE